MRLLVLCLVVVGCTPQVSNNPLLADAGPQADARPGQPDAQHVSGNDCRQYTTIATATDGTKTTRSTWYADVSVPGLDPTEPPMLSVSVCGRQCWGSACSTPQPCAAERDAGIPCQSFGGVPPVPDCYSGEQGIGTGHVYVFCGYRVTVVPSPGSTAQAQDGGWLYSRIYVRRL